MIDPHRFKYASSVLFCHSSVDNSTDTKKQPNSRRPAALQTKAFFV
jgi:hypothetical protein